MQRPNPETIRWTPPFCPNSTCGFHREPTSDWRWTRSGTYRRQSDLRCIQRFRCHACGRTFSTQTFSTSYWQKRPDLDARIFKRTLSCAANRQIARDIGVSPATVDRHIARLGRHCLLFHCSQTEGLPPPSEIVVDGFESFEWSQYFPIHHHVAVGKDNDFFYGFTDSPLRRKGRMTAYQKRRRAELEELHGRPNPKAVQEDMRELVRHVLRGRKAARIYSDDHPAYRRSLRGLQMGIDHKVTPGSRHRDRDNSLWEVNLLDLLIRHCSANHKRETIAWSKRRQASAERLAILLVWRNYIKARREKVRGSPTPAMEIGLMSRPLTINEVLMSRLFPDRTDLPRRWRQYYARAVETPVLAANSRHTLRFAY